VTWAGLIWDEPLGMYRSFTRPYDSETGGWIQEDPISFAGGTDNLSEYVGNAPTLYTDPSGLKRVIGDPSKSDGTVIIIDGGGIGTGAYINDMIKIARKHNLAVIIYDSKDDVNAFFNDKLPDNANGLIMAGHGAADVFCDFGPDTIADKIKEFKKLDFFVMRGCHSQDFLNNVNKELLKDGKNMLGPDTFTISNYGYITSLHLWDHGYLDEFLSGKRTGNDDVINHNYFWDGLGELIYKDNKKHPKPGNKIQ
jgi:RHS repeat-associated protein